MAEIKVKLTDSADQILNALDTDEGFGLSALAEEIGLSESATSRQVTRLRGLNLIERHRDEDGGLLIFLSSKGENYLRKDINVNQKLGGDHMAVSVKIQDDLVECLDELKEEEELSSYSEAVDFALADYFNLLEDDEQEEQLENQR